MELIEISGWITLGFLPGFGGLEIIRINLGTIRSRRKMVLRSYT
jgi:hypothetical protein